MKVNKVISLVSVGCRTVLLMLLLLLYILYILYFDILTSIVAVSYILYIMLYTILVLSQTDLIWNMIERLEFHLNIKIKIVNWLRSTLKYDCVISKIIPNWLDHLIDGADWEIDKAMCYKVCGRLCANIWSCRLRIMLQLQLYGAR